MIRSHHFSYSLWVRSEFFREGEGLEIQIFRRSYRGWENVVLGYLSALRAILSIKIERIAIQSIDSPPNPSRSTRNQTKVIVFFLMVHTN